ncbi:putative RNA recognition motif domain, nucleotide-binding alpha-beta plait domain superfamily [Dioscorea sansibarensis]
MIMSYSRRSRYASRSPSPYGDARSGSRTLSRSRSRGPDFSDVENPGNNLYVTGLSSRVTKDELEKHFATEGKVIDVHLVVDPWSRESRGFGFVTMETIEDANRCLKYLDGSVLEGRVITVEKARRRRGRTPTPGRYLGARTFHSRHRSPSDSPYYRSRYRSPSYTCERDRSYSPYYRRHRSYSRSRSPYYRRDSDSPARRRRSYSHNSRSYSPVHRRYYRSNSRSISPKVSYSPVCRRRYRSDSQSISPRVRRHSRSVSPRGRNRSYSCSISPRPIGRTSRRSYSRSYSPKPKHSRRRSYSRSYSPWMRRSKRSRSCNASPQRNKNSMRYSRESYSHSCSVGSLSKSVSSSPSTSG